MGHGRDIEPRLSDTTRGHYGTTWGMDGMVNGGDEGIRTLDLLNAIEALSQLSYIPTLPNYSKGLVGAQERDSVSPPT